MNIVQHSHFNMKTRPLPKPLEDYCYLNTLPESERTNIFSKHLYLLQQCENQTK